jgi:hypothetical protein
VDSAKPAISGAVEASEFYFVVVDLQGGYRFTSADGGVLFDRNCS